MKKILAVTTIFITWQVSSAQSKLPLSLNSSTDTSKSLIFYISGDGGFNKFSTSFMQTLNRMGYAVIGLNAKEYFWTKKNPQEAATAIEEAISESNRQWKKRNIVLIGYSFGADVAPFILTRFSPAMAEKVSQLILLSPSLKTDFEVHVLQMLGWGKDAGQSVPAEVDKVQCPVTVITGDDENQFPFNQLKAKNKQLIKMPGGHHYDGDISALCKQVASLSK